MIPHSSSQAAHCCEFRHPQHKAKACPGSQDGAGCVALTHPREGAGSQVGTPGALGTPPGHVKRQHETPAHACDSDHSRISVSEFVGEICRCSLSHPFSWRCISISSSPDGRVDGSAWCPLGPRGRQLGFFHPGLTSSAPSGSFHRPVVTLTTHDSLSSARRPSRVGNKAVGA